MPYIPRGEENIGFLIEVGIALLNRATVKDLGDLDITTTQFKTMNFLEENDGNAGQKEIADRFAISHATVSGVVNRLAEKGLVSIASDPTDSRCKIVSLTDEGIALVEHGAEVREKTDKVILQGISRAEQKEFTRTFMKIIHNLQSYIL